MPAKGWGGGAETAICVCALLSHRHCNWQGNHNDGCSSGVWGVWTWENSHRAAGRKRNQRVLLYVQL